MLSLFRRQFQFDVQFVPYGKMEPGYGVEPLSIADEAIALALSYPGEPFQATTSP